MEQEYENQVHDWNKILKVEKTSMKSTTPHGMYLSYLSEHTKGVQLLAHRSEISCIRYELALS